MLLTVIIGLFMVCFTLWGLISFIAVIADEGEDVNWNLSCLISIIEAFLLSCYIDYKKTAILVAALVVLLIVAAIWAIIRYKDFKTE